MIRVSCILRKGSDIDDVLAVQTAIVESKFGIAAEIIGRQGETIVRGQWVAQPFDAELAEFVAQIKEGVALVFVEYE